MNNKLSKNYSFIKNAKEYTKTKSCYQATLHSFSDFTKSIIKNYNLDFDRHKTTTLDKFYFRRDIEKVITDMQVQHTQSTYRINLQKHLFSSNDAMIEFTTKYNFTVKDYNSLPVYKIFKTDNFDSDTMSELFADLIQVYDIERVK